MPSLLLRGLKGTRVVSPTASSKHKQVPVLPLSLPSSSSPTRQSSLAPSAPASQDTTRPHSLVLSSSGPVLAEVQPNSSSSIIAFKRRLAHSVSALSLTRRSDKKQQGVRPSISTKEEPETSVNATRSLTNITSQNVLGVDTVRTFIESAGKPEPHLSSPSSSDFEPLHLSVRRKQHQRQSLRGYLHKCTSHRHTFIKMATDNAQPPVSYSRLQEITTSVSCLRTGTRKGHFTNEDRLARKLWGP
jgi:hypothetical protein